MIKGTRTIRLIGRKAFCSFDGQHEGFKHHTIEIQVDAFFLTKIDEIIGAELTLWQDEKEERNND